MKTTKLIDAFGDVLTDGGLFSLLNTLNVPWKNDVSANALDLEYFYNISGQKSISPLLRRFLNGATTITTAQKTTLANVLYDMYIKQWNKEYATLNLEYNPISNYDMTENETPAEITRTITPAETTTTETPAETTDTETPAETTRTISPAETTNTTKPAKTVSENEVSGFNSSSYVDDTKTTVTGDVNDKGTDVFTVNTSGSDSLDVDTAGTLKHEVDTAGNTKIEVDTAGSEVITVQSERTLTRSGNIGVTTSQQMIQSERELWLWNFFFEIVFPDIDEVLTLAIYQR